MSALCFLNPNYVEHWVTVLQKSHVVHEDICDLTVNVSCFGWTHKPVDDGIVGWVLYAFNQFVVPENNAK